MVTISISILEALAISINQEKNFIRIGKQNLPLFVVNDCGHRKK